MGDKVYNCADYYLLRAGACAIGNDAFLRRELVIVGTGCANFSFVLKSGDYLKTAPTFLVVCGYMNRLMMRDMMKYNFAQTLENTRIPMQNVIVRGGNVG